MSKFYYHGTDERSFFKIIETGEIKCRRLLEEEEIYIDKTCRLDLPGCNGYEYISLCNKLLNPEPPYYDSAYYTFILNHYCFIISDEVDAIKTIYRYDDSVIKLYEEEYDYYIHNDFGGDVRFSIMPDEYQVKTKITMDNIIGIGFPFKRLNKEQIDLLFDLSYKLNLDVVDTSYPLFIEEYENMKVKQKKLINRSY